MNAKHERVSEVAKSRGQETSCDAVAIVRVEGNLSTKANQYAAVVVLPESMDEISKNDYGSTNTGPLSPETDPPIDICKIPQDPDEISRSGNNRSPAASKEQDWMHVETQIGVLTMTDGRKSYKLESVKLGDDLIFTPLEAIRPKVGRITLILERHIVKKPHMAEIRDRE